MGGEQDQPTKTVPRIARRPVDNAAWPTPRSAPRRSLPDATRFERRAPSVTRRCGTITASSHHNTALGRGTPWPRADWRRRRRRRRARWRWNSRREGISANIIMVGLAPALGLNLCSSKITLGVEPGRSDDERQLRTSGRGGDMVRLTHHDTDRNLCVVHARLPWAALAELSPSGVAGAGGSPLGQLGTSIRRALLGVSRDSAGGASGHRAASARRSSTTAAQQDDGSSQLRI